MAISYRQKEGNLTILGAETEFDGVLKFTDNLVITGKFKGTIKSTGNLVIEKTGICDVDQASADSITAAGKINGNLFAKEKLEMFSGSRITGDIETGFLRIADNVIFHGEVRMLAEPPDIDIFSVSAAEYKRIVSRRAALTEEADV